MRMGKRLDLNKDVNKLYKLQNMWNYTSFYFLLFLSWFYVPLTSFSICIVNIQLYKHH